MQKDDIKKICTNENKLDLPKTSPSKPENPQSEAPSPKKILIAKFNGGVVPVDPHFQSHSSKTFHVYSSFGVVYSKTLNQCNLKWNNNKFYIIQILESDDPAQSDKEYIYYTRWGRVGQNGQNSSKFFANNAASAVQTFNQKFEDKAIYGGYTELMQSYNNEGQSSSENSNSKKKILDKSDKEKKDKESGDLDTGVQEQMELLFDGNMIDSVIKEIGYDQERLPLGKLSSKAFKIGYKILEALEVEIKKPTKERKKHIIDNLASDFYSHIPHNIGYQKTYCHGISTEEQLKQKIEMLESLEQIKLTTRIKDGIDECDNVNSMAKKYSGLNTRIASIDPNTETYRIVQDYLQKGHAPTHKTPIHIENLYSLEKEDLNEEIYNPDNLGNKKLLWHGSRLINFTSIQSQGFKIAPPEAPSTGYMFGKGIYFADMSSKAANYCHHKQSDNTGLLILCEVALGTEKEYLFADGDAAKLPNGCHSVFGRGMTGPVKENLVEFEDSAVPMGPVKRCDRNVYSGLLYNEYVVYNVNQIKMKYLIKLRFGA